MEIMSSGCVFIFEGTEVHLVNVSITKDHQRMIPIKKMSVTWEETDRTEKGVSISAITEETTDQDAIEIFIELIRYFEL